MIEWTRDEFDSRLLGRGVCKAWLHDDAFRPDDLAALCRRDAPELVCCFTPCSYRAAATMQDLAFRLVTVRSTYEAPPPAGAPQVAVPPGVELRRLADAPRVDEADLRALAELIGGTSRYFKDERIPHEAALNVYETWLTNSLHHGYAKDAVLAFSRGRLVGLHTLRLRDGVLTVDLIGVLASHQGSGLGAALLQEGMRIGHELGATRVRVVTEAENVPACRMYQRHGFLLTATELVWHKHLGI